MTTETSSRPTGRRWLRPALAAALLVLATAAFLCRNGLLPQATALPLPGAKGKDAPAATAPAPAEPSDYSRRVVAYLNGNEPITREMLGEYLIARHGAECLELLVNKLIIEEACKKAHVEVTAAEVDQALAEDLKGINVNLHDFVDKVLKHYNKNLYEWKEDVIKPRLALTKLCRDRVHVTDDELKQAFDAYYGEKVECRIILFPRDQTQIALQVYGKVRDSEEEFDRAARTQASASLAANKGLLKPFGRHTTGNEQLEKEAFALKPGEVSSVIGTPEGPVILKCVQHLPPDPTKKLETERAFLEKEVFDRKVQQEIPVYFKALREQAHPNLILKNYTKEEDLVNDVRQELGPTDGSQAARPLTAPPHGN